MSLLMFSLDGVYPIWNKTYFICLHLYAVFGSYSVVFVEYGFSRSIEVGERSLVRRSLIITPWPPKEYVQIVSVHCEWTEGLPMALAEPGSIREVVTPPAMLSS
jgi:hypothetical protein